MTLEHISIVGVAVTIAIVTGVPIGILITRAGPRPTACSTSRP
jgi:ABC-type proline/glycine betaine transport system permease subunit